MRSVEDILLQLNLQGDNFIYPFRSSAAPYRVTPSCCIMHLHAAHDHCATHTSSCPWLHTSCCLCIIMLHAAHAAHDLIMLHAAHPNMNHRHHAAYDHYATHTSYCLIHHRAALYWHAHDVASIIMIWDYSSLLFPLCWVLLQAYQGSLDHHNSIIVVVHHYGYYPKTVIYIYIYIFIYIFNDEI